MAKDFEQPEIKTEHSDSIHELRKKKATKKKQTEEKERIRKSVSEEVPPPSPKTSDTTKTSIKKPKKSKKEETEKDKNPIRSSSDIGHKREESKKPTKTEPETNKEPEKNPKTDPERNKEVEKKPKTHSEMKKESGKPRKQERSLSITTVLSEDSDAEKGQKKEQEESDMKTVKTYPVSSEVDKERERKPRKTLSVSSEIDKEQKEDGKRKRTSSVIFSERQEATDKKSNISSDKEDDEKERKPNKSQSETTKRREEPEKDGKAKKSLSEIEDVRKKIPEEKKEEENGSRTTSLKEDKEKEKKQVTLKKEVLEEEKDKKKEKEDEEERKIDCEDSGSENTNSCDSSCKSFLENLSLMSAIERTIKSELEITESEKTIEEPKEERGEETEDDGRKTKEESEEDTRHQKKKTTFLEECSCAEEKEVESEESCRSEEAAKTEESAGTPKVMIVDDNVIEKIRNLIYYLEAKAECEGVLAKEYMKLVLDYVDYLSKVLQCLVKKKQAEQAQNTFLAAQMHLKFDEKQSDVKGFVPRSVSASNLGTGEFMAEDDKKKPKEKTQDSYWRGGSDEGLLRMSESDISLESTEEISFVPPAAANQRVVTTKIRLLQDLIKKRAEFVPGSMQEFRIIHHPQEEYVPEQRARNVKIVSEQDEDGPMEDNRMKFFRALLKFCRCGKKKQEVDGIYENLKGEAVRVDVTEDKRNPANATLNPSTIEVLKASGRKKIINKYYSKE